MVDDGDDDYDVGVDDEENETPTMDIVIEQFIETKLYDMHTSLPGTVVKLKANNRVDIQLDLQRKFTDGTLSALPVLQDVLVYSPSGQDWWMKCPIAVGDVGHVHFMERSIDTWKVEGGLTDPNDTRRHDLADGVFYPGLRPFSDALPGNADDMVLHNGKAEVYLQKAGKFKLANDANELFAILSQVIETLSTASTVVGGPFTADVVQELVQMKTQIDSLKGS